MRAAWYEKQGPAREVLRVGVMADPTPGPREVRVRIAASGINPGDTCSSHVAQAPLLLPLSEQPRMNRSRATLAQIMCFVLGLS
jgi:NADPH:quinone reductase-like Zn-dependent oxidoreductase